MAGRSPKIGLPYFMHDTDMSADPKFEFIEATHGIVGFAVILKIYERIYRDGYYTKWPERDVTVFSKKIGVDIAVVKSIVVDALAEGIFDSRMYENEEILTSHGIQVRFLHATSKRVASAIDPRYSLLNTVPKTPKSISASEMPISTEEIPIPEEEMPISASEMQQVSKERKVSKGKEAEEVQATAPPPPTVSPPIHLPKDQVSARDGSCLEAYLINSWGIEARKIGWDIKTAMLDLGIRFTWDRLYYAIDQAAKYDKKNLAYIESIVDPEVAARNRNRKDKSWEEAFNNRTT
jgi:hypothetical protein